MPPIRCATTKARGPDASTFFSYATGSILRTVFAVPGMPSVYAGDEQAFRGVKGSGAEADDALRPELPASPADLAAEGWWLHEHYRALVALRRARTSGRLCAALDT